MIVKEVIEKSAELLGIELTDENTERLLTSYNLVENELAMYYFPLRLVDKLLVQYNKIKYAELSEQAWRIINVLDFQNDEVKFRLYPEYIELKKNYNWHYFFVLYNYVPKEKLIYDNCEYNADKEDLIKYGVCAEYCLANGDYEQASFWQGKYKNLIKIAYITRRKNEN